MAARQNKINLLIHADLQEQEEQLASLLRSAGRTVNISSFAEPAALNKLLGSAVFDLLLLPASQGKLLGAITKILGTQGRELSVLAVATDGVNTDPLPLFELGARDVLDLSRPELSLAILRRELGDLSARRQLRRTKTAYEELDQRFIEMMESSRDAIACLQNGTLLQANSTFAERFGFKNRKELEGLPFLDLVTEPDQDAMRNVLQDYANGESLPANMELHIKGAKGIPVPIHMELKQNQSQGRPSILLTIRKQDSNKELENKLRMLKNQDLLTGLFNRQYFLDKLESTIQKAGSEGKTYTLMYIDVDDFNELKNRLGIAGSDMVLVEIAELLRKLLEVTHYTARYDGNVFTALLAIEDSKAAMQMAKRIIHAIENHNVTIESKKFSTTCSIGVCLIGDNTLNAKDALNNAHKAADMARAAGGNRVRIHIPMDDELADRELQNKWQQEIDTAFEQERFHLVYQPIVSLHGEAGEKYGALLRLQGAEGEAIPPSQFIPAAEKTGLITKLDRWVIERSIENLSQQLAAGRDTTLFIKLSLPTIEEISLTPWLSQLLKKHEIDGKQLVFEVCEEFSLLHMKALKVLSTGLRKLGCALALDHFGRTPKSAAVQKHLQASYLKIDGTIIGELGGNSDALDKIKTINAIATATNSQTIAQFVEDANCLAQLWQTGVNYIQGYFVQEPDALMNYDFSE